MRQAFSLATAFAILVGCVASVNADEPDTKPITIPLKDIWGWQMPGTKNARTLEPEAFGEEAKKLSDEERQLRFENSLAIQIQKRLDSYWKPEDVGPGFAVAGTGRDALREAHAVIVLGKKPQEVFTTDSELSLVFFTSLSIQYVQLRDVQLLNNIAELRFAFVPHDSAEVTAHFALIPVGKLHKGEFDVKIVQLPLEAKYVKAGSTAITAEQGSRIVCKPFSFSVKENEYSAAKYPGGTLPSKLATP